MIILKKLLINLRAKMMINKNIFINIFITNNYDIKKK